MAKIKWPTRFWCVDRWWPVRQIDKPVFARLVGSGKKQKMERHCWGFCNTSNYRPHIEVAMTRHPQDVLTTFLHEIGHAVCLQVGFEYPETEAHWDLFMRYFTTALQSCAIIKPLKGQEWK